MTPTLAPIRPNRPPAPAARSTVRRMGPSDALLSVRLRAGDERALAEAYDAHAAAVHRVAVAVLGEPAAAQDVVQDVFVELWSHPDRYQPSLAPLHHYLTLCARHRAVDLLRSEQRRSGREGRHARLVPEQRPAPPAEQVAEAETRSAVRHAVDVLPPAQREVVQLAYFDGLSYREVARVLQIPEGTAKSRLRLALARLESVLDRRLMDTS